MTAPANRVAGLALGTFGAKVAVQLLGTVSSIVIARTLGPTGRGRYFLPVSLGNIVLSVARVGTDLAQYRMWTRRDAEPRDLVASGLALGGVLGAAGTALTLAAYWLLPDRVLEGVGAIDVAIVAATLPVQTHLLLASEALILSGGLRRLNLATICAAVLQMVALVATAATGVLTVRVVLALFAASVVTPWLIILPPVLRLGADRLLAQWQVVRQQLALGFRLQPSVLFSFLHLRIDVFFVALHRGLDDVGLYSVAVVLAELMWLATDSVMLGATERQANATEAASVDMTVRSVRMSVLASIVIGAAIAASAPVAIPTLYGRNFADATVALWILLPAAAAMAVWRAISNALLRFGGTALHPSIAGACLAGNVAANAVLVPAHGIVGAAIASCLSYALGAVLAARWLVGRTTGGSMQLVPTGSEVRALVDSARHPLARLRP